MKINYFFRHPKVGFSIQRVFKTLINELNKSIESAIYEVPAQGSMPIDLIKNNIFTFNRREKKTVHHVTGHIHDVLLSLMGLTTVLTIHDLVFLDNINSPAKRFYKWLFWLYLPIKIANKVVCISNQTKNNILTKIKTDKLTVIHNAVDPIFSFSEKAFNERKPVILHIGTGWNKNLNKTIQALEGISCQIRIIGKLRDSQMEMLEKYKTDYSNQSNLTDLEIRDEYLRCDMVNFPSVYEGFGMPIIEGQKTGRVVVTSNIEPLTEVASDAAAYVNPNDVSNMRQTYLKVIKDTDYRKMLIDNGKENAKRFSVENIARQYLELYQTLVLK